MRRHAWIVLPAALLCAAPASASLPPARGADPVVLTGSAVPKLIGKRPDRIAAFAFANGRLRSVPVQVDQRAPIDLGRVYGAQPTGVVVTAYTDPGTLTGADPNPKLDADDEIAFMASDLGGVAPRRVARGVRVRVRDPLSRRTGVLYLVVARKPVRAPRSYVSYRFKLNAGSYPGAYRFNAGPNPENSTVATHWYSAHFSDRWIDDGLRIGGGPNILDRYTVQFAPGVCIRSEDTFAAGEGAFIANTSGPVRAIRSYLGANSGPLTQRTEVFYARRADYRTDLRVHAIGGVMDLFDYSPAALGMTYRSAALPSGVTIDGRPDSVPGAPLSWEQVSGHQGTLSIAHSLTTDIPRISPSSYYLDQTSPTSNQDRLCTSDKLSRGASGSWIKQAIPATDPNQGGHNSLSAERTLYFDPPGGGASLAGKRAAQAEHPLVATTR